MTKPRVTDSKRRREGTELSERSRRFIRYLRVSRWREPWRQTTTKPNETHARNRQTIPRTSDSGRADIRAPRTTHRGTKDSDVRARPLDRRSDARSSPVVSSIDAGCESERWGRRHHVHAETSSVVSPKRRRNRRQRRRSNRPKCRSTADHATRIGSDDGDDENHGRDEAQTLDSTNDVRTRYSPVSLTCSETKEDGDTTAGDVDSDTVRERGRCQSSASVRAVLRVARSMNSCGSSSISPACTPQRCA